MHRDRAFVQGVREFSPITDDEPVAWPMLPASIMGKTRLSAACSGLVMFVSVASAGPRGRPMVLAVPAEEPRGFVELASFGMAELTPAGSPSVLVLHVRLTITDIADDTPWSIDLAAATVAVGTAPQAQTLFASSDLETMPLALIARGERRTFDLYFPAAAAEPAAFDFMWRIKTATGPIDTHALFQREDPQADTVDVAPKPGWGASWWLAPSEPPSPYDAGLVAPRAHRSIGVRWPSHGKDYQVKTVSW